MDQVTFPCKSCGCATGAAPLCYSCWVASDSCMYCGTSPTGETGECRHCHVHGSKYGLERARRQRLLDAALAERAHDAAIANADRTARLGTQVALILLTVAASGVLAYAAATVIGG
jgi:hypothetical protein